MRLRALALSVAFCASGLVAADMASAAELAVPYAHHAYRAHHARYVYRTGYVYWDDVYPPALYGPTLRPVEEVAAIKAQRAPVSAHWNSGWGWVSGWYY